MNNTPTTQRWLRWGPIDGTWIALSYPCNIPQILWKHYRIEWPDINGWIMSNGKQWMWIQPLDALEQKGWKAFNEWMLIPKKRQVVRTNYEQHVQKMRVYSNQIYNNEHMQWTNEQLLSWFKQWTDDFITFWAHATLPELVTWGAEATLRKEIQHKGDTKAEIEIMEALTAPTALSFFQNAELDLLHRIAHTTRPQERKAAIESHLQQYYWVSNSYAQAHRRTIKDAEELILLAIKNHGSITNAIQSLEQYIQHISKKRKEIQQKYQLTDTLMRWSVALGDAISWQDERKGEQMRQHDVLYTMVNECSKRFNIRLDHAYWLSGPELIEYCNNGTPIVQLVECRMSGFTVEFRKSGIKTLCGNAAVPLLQEHWELAPTTEQLTGQVASFGKQNSTTFTGRVCIVLSPQEAHHFHDGDILVSCMTSPDYMPIMKKASAIITDEGGLTAHAAVVSRELGIPCIVATKYATKVLHNGDQVTLNIQAGTIQKQ